MPIELNNTSINVINGADTFQVDFVKSKGSYTEKAADSATYSCGSGWYGTLGHSSGGIDNKWWSPTLTQYFIDNKITIIDFSGGNYHSLFLDTNGYVYSCGENSEGRLGHGNTSNKSTPTLIQNYIDSNGSNINYTNITISKIFAGYYHSIFLDTNGNVYSCGANFSYQLGHGDTNAKTAPTLIQNYIDSNGSNINYTNITISQISGGYYHSMFLDTNGYVYSCGGSSNGQTGHGNTNTDYYIPTSIPFFVDNGITISKISAGTQHSMFLDTNGYVYSCGYNYYGQLGHGDTTDKSTPTLIQTFTDSNGNTNYTAITISKISAGTQHSMFLDTNGYVYSCGNGSNGRTGHGNEDNKSIPTLIETYIGVNSNSINYTDITISQVSSGDMHTIFLNTNSNVYTCGGNYYGELGYGVNNDSNRPKLVEYFVNNNIIISYINAGINHSIFLSSDPYYQTIEYDAQWTYSSSDASVYHLGNVGIGTYPSNTKILNVHNGINFTGDLYINDSLFDTPKYKHTHIRENNYLPDIFPSISPTYIPNSNEYYIYSFVYDPNNDNGSGQTEYTINFYQETECDVLIVGGGGGGDREIGGGGGGGAVLYAQKIQIPADTYIVKVGNGGNQNQKGFQSEAFGATCLGGGSTSYIAWSTGNAGNSGGSGSGGSSNGGAGGGVGTSTIGTFLLNNVEDSTFINLYNGNVGGNAGTQTSLGGGNPVLSGGGGGAGESGYNGSLSARYTNNSSYASWVNAGSPGKGGDGVLINITGDDYYWGAGGGGGSYQTLAGTGGKGGGGAGGQYNNEGTQLGGGDAINIGQNGGISGTGYGGNAGAHTGSGGGGGGWDSTTQGGKGGSGIVIIRCKIVTSDLNIPTLSSGVITELNKFDQYNILTFNYDTNYLKNIDYPVLAADATNLVLWYKFDGKNGNDNLLDSNPTSTKYNLINGGDITFGYDGYIGESAIFNGGPQTGNGYLQIDPSFNIYDTWNGNGITISVWFKYKSGTANYSRIFNFSVNDSLSNQIGISKNDTNSNGSLFFFMFYNGTEYSSISNNNVYTYDKWHHIAWSISSTGEWKAYIDNVRQNFTRTNGIPNVVFNKNYFGKSMYTSNNMLTGNINDFRIYDKALSAEEVYDLYKPIDNAKNQSKYTLQFDTDTECDFLIVAGGGGGCGNNNDLAGGGGGAGELLEKYNITFTANTQYTIVVGNGGLGQLVKTSPAIEGYDSGIYTGTDGDTPFYHSKGGGRGGNGYYVGEQIFDATSGGSGGGAGMISGANNNVNGLSVKYNTDGRGHDGKVNVGNDAGSGGGAGSIGEYASSSVGQAQSLPGKGYTSYITGEAVTYASGGYGGWQYSRNTANAGKGSGGWGYGGPQGQAGFPGGNGIEGTVIIRYKYVNTIPAPTITFSMNSWTYTDDGNVYYTGNVGIGLSRPTERLDVNGSITGNTKSFKIQHPLNNTTSLYHGNIECPRYDNLYRGRATIVGGTCIVNIDSECNDTGGLIEGTFDALNTDSQLYLQNNQTFDNVKGTIENGKIYIECENTEDEITINWIVIAERKDINVFKLNNTDTAGKLICEQFK